MFYQFNFPGGSSVTGSSWLEKDSQKLIILCGPLSSPDQCFYVNPTIHKRTIHLRAKLRHLVDGGRSHMYSWRGKVFLVFKNGEEMSLRWGSLSSIHDRGNFSH